MAPVLAAPNTLIEAAAALTAALTVSAGRYDFRVIAARRPAALPWVVLAALAFGSAMSGILYPEQWIAAADEAVLFAP